MRLDAVPESDHVSTLADTVERVGNVTHVDTEPTNSVACNPAESNPGNERVAQRDS